MPSAFRPAAPAFLLALAAALVLLGEPAFAADQGLSGIIGAVDAKQRAFTVTRPGYPAVQIRIGRTCSIYFGLKRATFEDLAAGQRVFVLHAGGWASEVSAKP
jgi:hypothetical protein